MIATCSTCSTRAATDDTEAFESWRSTGTGWICGRCSRLAQELLRLSVNGVDAFDVDCPYCGSQATLCCNFGPGTPFSEKYTHTARARVAQGESWQLAASYCGSTTREDFAIGELTRESEDLGFDMATMPVLERVNNRAVSLDRELAEAQERYGDAVNDLRAAEQQAKQQKRQAVQWERQAVQWEAAFYRSQDDLTEAFQKMEEMENGLKVEPGSNTRQSVNYVRLDEIVPKVIAEVEARQRRAVRAMLRLLPYAEATGKAYDAYDEAHPLPPCPECGSTRRMRIDDGRCFNFGRCKLAPVGAGG